MKPILGQLENTSTLPAAKHIVSVSVGYMSALPLQAVLDIANPGHGYIVSHTPSASVYALLSSSKGNTKGKAGRALVIADPGGDLESARAIAPRIRGYFSKDSQLLMGDRIAASLGNGEPATSWQEFDLIHVASHVQGSGSPLETAFDWRTQHDRETDGAATQADGLVKAAEVARKWKLDTDLVVVAGCSSGEGFLSTNDGQVGMSHALLAAGARKVVVSHWPVDDAATALLMNRFYQLYSGAIGDPRTASDALAEAKTWLKNVSFQEANRILIEINKAKSSRGGTAPRREHKEGSAFSHPKYWAGFSLIGGQ